MKEPIWKKFLSRKFLVTVGTLVSHLFGVQLPMEVALAVAAYVAGQAGVDFAKERSRAEVEKVTREGADGGGGS